MSESVPIPIPTNTMSSSESVNDDKDIVTSTSTLIPITSTKDDEDNNEENNHNNENNDVDVKVVTEEQNSALAGINDHNKALAVPSITETSSESTPIVKMETTSSRNITSTSSGPDNTTTTETASNTATLTANNTTTTTDATSNTGTTVRPSWNHGNRKVLIQGVLKFHNATAMKKDLLRWFDDMKNLTKTKEEMENVNDNNNNTNGDNDNTKNDNNNNQNNDNENNKQRQDIVMEFEKVKKPPKESWMIVTMKEEYMVQPLIDYINNNDIRTKKGIRLFAKLVVEIDRNENEHDNDNDNEHRTTTNKRRIGNSDKDMDYHDDENNNNRTNKSTNNKRQRTENDDTINQDENYENTATTATGTGTGTTTTSGSNNNNMYNTKNARRPVTDEEIQDKMVPLWKLSFDEQKNQKVKLLIKQCAVRIIAEIKNKFRTLNKDKNRKKLEVYPWVADQKRSIFMNPIISSPTPLRNKSEFTFGYRYLFDDTNEGNHVAVSGSSIGSNNTNNTDKTLIVEKKNVLATPMGEVSRNNNDDHHHRIDDTATNPVDTPMEMTQDEGTVLASSATKMNEDNEVSLKFVPACGFLVTGWAGGVCRPHCCGNIPPEHCSVVDIIDNFLQTCSSLPVYDSTLHTGFWRLLTIRTSRRTMECMIIIQHTSPTKGGEGDTDESCSMYETHFESERRQLIEKLTSLSVPIPNEEHPLTVTSVFFQEFSGVSSPQPEHPVQHAYGKNFLTERLGKCIFQISPGSFFQVNTEGAELLYQLVVDKVREVTNNNPTNTLLFDVCCGTGTIGITCLKEVAVGHVVGVDISEPAIMDAKANAELNGFVCEDDKSDGCENVSKPATTRFVAARAENVLENEIRSTTRQNKNRSLEAKVVNFVAVVDPARDGLHTEVVKAIRANEQIKRLVYVSCNPAGSLVQDAVLFCTPPTKKYSGQPFRITSATPVDMFPLTNHCEMVMIFDR